MKKIVILSSLAALVFAGTVEVTGIRQSNLNNGSENLKKIEYSQALPIPGQVKLYKKSYKTAPPMIPHKVGHMVPIKVGKNECLMCHMPLHAKKLGIPQMPEDHFVDNFDKDKKQDRVAGSRYFCTTCHAPQANVKLAVQNHFDRVRVLRKKIYGK